MLNKYPVKYPKKGNHEYFTIFPLHCDLKQHTSILGFIFSIHSLCLVSASE